MAAPCRRAVEAMRIPCVCQTRHHDPIVVAPTVAARMTDDRTEWLEADGLGGFASGTTSGIRTRRYHALLLTATTPPTGRIVLVNGFDAWVTTPAGRFALSTQRYQPGVLHPDGYTRIVSFSSEPW